MWQLPLLAHPGPANATYEYDDEICLYYMSHGVAKLTELRYSSCDKKAMFAEKYWDATKIF